MPHLDLISLSSWVVIGGASLTAFYVVSLWGLRSANDVRVGRERLISHEWVGTSLAYRKPMDRRADASGFPGQIDQWLE